MEVESSAGDLLISQTKQDHFHNDQHSLSRAAQIRIGSTNNTGTEWVKTCFLPVNLISTNLSKSHFA